MSRRRAGALAGDLCLGVLLWQGGCAGGIAGLLAGLTLVRELRRARALSRERAEATLIVGSLEALSLELRCGAAPLAALGAIGRVTVASQVGTAGAALLAAGEAEDLSAAAAALATGPPALRALADALRLSEATGVSLAGLADALGKSSRDQQEADRELADELVGARSSADLLTALPVLGIVLAEGIGARPLHVLLHTTAGACCLIAGVGLASLGRLWTGALMERARVAGHR